MIEKLIKIANVGILAEGVPHALDLQKATLIYAENARGKSTLTAIARSLATGDGTHLLGRKTIGGTGTQSVQLRIKDGTGTKTVQFNGSSWTDTDSRLVVFDQAFVDGNVYSGSEVSASQNEALLTFALGAAAVIKKQEVDRQATAQVQATKARTTAEDKLKGYARSMPVSRFVDLPVDADVNTKLATVKRRLESAKSIAAINARPLLALVSLPQIDFDSVGTMIGQSVEGLQDDAERLVQEHFKRLGGSHVEKWARQGLQFEANSDDCPYCAQTVTGIPLVAAYRAHFSENYEALIASIDENQKAISLEKGTELAEAIGLVVRQNEERRASWPSDVNPPVPPLDLPQSQARLQDIYTELSRIIAQKASSPLTAYSIGELESARTRFDEVTLNLRQYNLVAQEANAKFHAYRTSLASEDIIRLNAEIETLEAVRLRHTPEVDEIARAFLAAGASRKAAEDAKTVARAELEALTATELTRYEGEINRLLGNFAAPFTVSSLKASFLGGGNPRADYCISLRGQDFSVGKISGGGPTFRTVLSDGDKRTLALALFLAKLNCDPPLSNKIVVLDDVFASLDQNRRFHTCVAIEALARNCTQVIVLAHDPYFLREVAKLIAKKNTCSTATLMSRRVAHDFSEIVPCDLDEVCATDYFKRYEVLLRYIQGAQTDLLLAAKSIRPIVEGHLHRRFPGQIRSGVTLGAALKSISAAPHGSPLLAISSSVQGLTVLNDFAAEFHHDTANSVERTAVTDGELRPFAERALKFIHEGQLV